MKHFPGFWFRVVTTISHNPLALVGGVLLCLSPIAAPGQSVTFAGARSTLPANGLSEPNGVAVDSAGNVFIGGFTNNEVLESPLTAAGYGPLTILPASLNFVEGVAVDSAGDVFIADAVNKRFVELPKTPTGFGPQTTLPFSGSSVSFPSLIALDAAGNVYVNSFESSDVFVLPKTATGYGPQTIVPFTFKPEFSFLTGMAVDIAGDVFVSDQNENGNADVAGDASGVTEDSYRLRTAGGTAVQRFI